MKVDYLKNIRVISKLLEGQFSILGFKIGLDPLLGLIPGVGDILALGLGAYIIYNANQLGVSSRIVFKMWFNLFLDLVLGIIPGVGDITDFFFRANTKNLKLLEDYLEQRRVEEEGIVG